jgi:betaine-aldehyde dehydrogenase
MTRVDRNASPDQRRDGVRRAAETIAGRLLLGDGWADPHATRRRVSSDPSSGVALGEFAVADGEDVDRAIRGAADAQRGWARLSVAERASRFMRFHELLAPEVEWLAVCDSVDAGLPLRAMRGEAAAAVELVRQWPGYALAATGEVFERGDGGLHYTASAPYGVVVRIVAYNHPTYAALAAIAPALLAGNALVLKPSDQTPISALAIAEIAARALGPGLVNVVTGDGETGRALVTHPAIRRVGFTGGTATGLRVQQAASEDQVRHVTLELSGKNAMLVRADADLDAVADGVLRGMNLTVNQGQSCGSTSRVYADDAVHDALVDRVAGRLSQLRIGVAYADDTDMGPLISAEHAAAVRDHVEAAVAGGARALRPVAPADEGCFVAPVVLTGLAPEQAAMREEIFGPVICFAGWSDEREALRRVNDSRFGLSASIWTQDVARGLALVDAVEAGYVWLNSAGEFPWTTPFGGWKDSGLGKQETLAELRSYQQSKTVHVRVGDA